MAKQNRFSFAFQAFVIGLVLVLVLSITRGAIYEEERRRAEYPSGISAVSVYRDYLSPAEPLPLELIREVVERGGMVTEYLPKALGATYDYLGTTPAYLEVFAPSLRLGRYFTEDDYMQPVCLVSEQVAKGLYGTIAESLGKTFKTELFPAGFEIIGVLEDGEKLPVQTVDEMGTELERFNISSNSFVIYPMSSVRMPIGFNAYRTVWVEGSPPCFIPRRHVGRPALYGKSSTQNPDRRWPDKKPSHLYSRGFCLPGPVCLSSRLFRHADDRRLQTEKGNWSQDCCRSKTCGYPAPGPSGIWARSAFAWAFRHSHRLCSAPPVGKGPLPAHAL